MASVNSFLFTGQRPLELVAGLDPLLLHFTKDDDEAGVDLPPGDVAKLEQFLATLSETLTEATEAG